MLKKCRECGAQISTDAKACPQCGAQSLVGSLESCSSGLTGCGCVLVILGGAVFLLLLL